MSTFSNNPISGRIDPFVMNQIRETFQNLNNLLPFLVGIDALQHVQRQELFPPHISPVEVNEDLTLFNQLAELLTLSQQLTEKIQDTKIQVGIEAQLSALKKEYAASDPLGN
jgi:hypothetical protein